jgi:hypothetical protein
VQQQRTAQDAPSMGTNTQSLRQNDNIQNQKYKKKSKVVTVKRASRLLKLLDVTGTASLV